MFKKYSKVFENIEKKFKNIQKYPKEIQKYSKFEWGKGSQLLIRIMVK